MPAIVVEDLSKTYYITKKSPGLAGAVKGLFSREKTAVEAVREVSFSIEEGELVGFLGPNGAGKTTTLKMLSGILFPTAGRAQVLGFKPWERRPEMQKQISLVMGNKMQLWWDLPAWDSFQVLKEIYEVPSADFKPRVERLIETLQLEDKVHTQVRRLSLGERMKCELVAALLHNPRVVFLDEPTIGLDVISQKRIREFLKEFNRDFKTTILLTSHYMQDVTELCDRIVVIDRGSLVFDGSLALLSHEFNPVKLLRLVFREEINSDLSQYGKVISSSNCEAVIEVPKGRTIEVASQMLRELPVEDIAINEVDVEDVIRDLFSRSGAV
jgi:ABC-2 type transport system ATP-binding protein